MGITTSLPYPNPTSYQEWATDFEIFAGLPTSPQETAIISAWEQSENPASQVGGYTKQGGYNALNTSLKTGSSGLEPGSSFIPVYPDINAALSATLSTLQQPNYAPELDALESQSGSGLVAALGSPGHVWGSSPSLVSKILGTGASTTHANASSNKTGTASGTGAGAQSTADTQSAQSTNAGVKVLASLDTVLNGGGFLSALNPLNDAKVIIARAGCVMLGLMFLVAGGFVLVKDLLGAEQAQGLLSGTGPIGAGAGAITKAAPVAALAA
jgi:hypothetical protein